MINIAELRRLLAEATPGPWHARTIIQHSGPRVAQIETEKGQGPWQDRQIAPAGFWHPLPPDAALIVVAVNALPGLLDRLDELRRENEIFCERDIVVNDTLVRLEKLERVADIGRYLNTMLFEEVGPSAKDTLAELASALADLDADEQRRGR